MATVRHVLVATIAVLVGVAIPWRVAEAGQPGEAAQAAEARQAPDLQHVLDTYLMQDCAGADEDPTAALYAVLSLSSAALPELLSIVERGPSERVRGEAEDVARADFRGLGKGRRRDLGLDEQRYVDMRVRGFSEAYRERALNALLATDDAVVLQSLSRMVARGAVGDDFLRNVAKAVQGSAAR
jgi:hypothetical protein